MAFLNQQEREKLLDELKNKSFNRIKGRLRKIDPKGELAYYRNIQETGRWMTRYVLHGLGTQVTLVEKQSFGDKNRNQYELVEIIVEPLPGNRL